MASKMMRLFKYGLAVEFVNKGINPNAITEFEDVHIDSKFRVWRPMNEHDYNQMLMELSGAGLISKETGIEKNTESAPDELKRIERQEKEKEKNNPFTQNANGVVENNSTDDNNGNNTNGSEQNGQEEVN